MATSYRILRSFALLVVLSPVVLGDVVVSRLGGKPPVRGISLEANSTRVAVQSAQGPVVTVPAEDVVEIAVMPPPAGPPAKSRPFEVELVDGTRLRGMLAAGKQSDFVRLRSPALRQTGGQLDIDLEIVLAVRRVDGTKGPGGSRLVRIPDKDAAYKLPDGSRVEGFVSAFKATEVEIDRGARGKSLVPYRLLAAVFIDNDEMPAPGGLHLVARLADGSKVVLGEGFRMEAGILSGRTPSGLAVRIPAAQLVAIGFKGGRFVHLSDLAPKEIKREPFFPLPEGPAAPAMLDFVCPIRFDKSPDGRGIRLHKRRYFKGIGVRPHTEIRYRLDGNYRTFEALCGIDDEVLGAGYGRGAGTGSVVFAVHLDGKTVFESDPVEGGEPPVPVRVSLPQTPAELTLVVKLVPKEKMPRGAPDSPELDNAVWARPLLIR